MIQSIEDVLADPRRSGVYRTDASADDLAAAGDSRGFRFFHLDGDRIRTVADLFLSFKEQLHAQYLSAEEDWNGLDEYLVDMDEFPDARGFVIFYDRYDDFAQANPNKWEVLLKLLSEATKSWLEKGKPMFVFLRGKAADDESRQFVSRSRNA